MRRKLLLSASSALLISCPAFAQSTRPADAAAAAGEQTNEATDQANHAADQATDRASDATHRNTDRDSSATERNADRDKNSRNNAANRNADRSMDAGNDTADRDNRTQNRRDRGEQMDRDSRQRDSMDRDRGTRDRNMRDDRDLNRKDRFDDDRASRGRSDRWDNDRDDAWDDDRDDARDDDHRVTARTYDGYHSYEGAGNDHRARSEFHPGYVPYGPTGHVIRGEAFDDSRTFATESASTFSIRGEIDRIRMNDSDRAGAAEDVLATIDDPRYGLYTINLGPRGEIADLNLDRSDVISVQGRCSERDRDGHLVASTLDFNGETIALGQGRGERFASSGREIRGEIVATRMENVRDERHVIARVRGESGRIELIDLGPERGLNGVELREGQRVQLRTESTRGDARNSLLATQIRIDGRTIDLDRNREMRLQGQPVSPGNRDMQRGDRQMDRNRDRMNDQNRSRDKDSAHDRNRSNDRNHMNRDQNDRDRMDNGSQRQDRMESETHRADSNKNASERSDDDANKTDSNRESTQQGQDSPSQE